MSYHLALFLAEKGHDVVFISYRPYFHSPIIKNINKNKIFIYSWKTIGRPVKFIDALWVLHIYMVHQPKIIIGHFTGAKLAIILCKLFSLGTTKTLCYYHTLSSQLNKNNDRSYLFSKIIKLRTKIFYRIFCTKILATSKKALDDYHDFFGNQNGIAHLTPLPDRKKTGLFNDLNGLTIGYLGRLDESKGIIPLFSAFEKFWSRYPNTNIRLKIAGDGKLLSTVRSFSNIHDKCDFLGHLNYSDIDNFIISSSAIIIPSISDNLVTVGIETLMNGKPLIISENTGLSGYLNPGIDCLIIKPEKGNIYSVIKDIEMKNIDLNTIARNGRITFLKFFTTTKYLKTMTQIIELIS